MSRAFAQTYDDTATVKSLPRHQTVHGCSARLQCTVAVRGCSDDQTPSIIRASTVSAAPYMTSDGVITEIGGVPQKIVETVYKIVAAVHDADRIGPTTDDRINRVVRSVLIQFGTSVQSRSPEPSIEDRKTTHIIFEEFRRED